MIEYRSSLPQQSHSASFAQLSGVSSHPEYRKGAEARQPDCVAMLSRRAFSTRSHSAVLAVMNVRFSSSGVALPPFICGGKPARVCQSACKCLQVCGPRPEKQMCLPCIAARRIPCDTKYPYGVQGRFAYQASPILRIL